MTTTDDATGDLADRVDEITATLDRVLRYLGMPEEAELTDEEYEAAQRAADAYVARLRTRSNNRKSGASSGFVAGVQWAARQAAKS